MPSLNGNFFFFFAVFKKCILIFLTYSMLSVRTSSFQLCISVWVLQEKTMFTIPWKHAARHGWELDKDASLFKEWAIHTGEQACIHIHANSANNKKDDGMRKI